MEKTLQKRYGFWVAVAMVIGIVIGSGVFFKAEKVLNATGGEMFIGVLAWVIGGGIMIVCAYNFAILASKYEKVNGIVDYAEAAVGKNYGYLFGWFMATIYYPSLSAILAWLSARYTAVLVGFEDPVTGVEVFLLAGFYMIIVYTINSLAPVLSGKFQVSTTIIKLIPLLLMAIVGLIKGIISGQTVENFIGVTTDIAVSNPLLTSIVATAFAYEGWIVATTINSELRDSKKNLPKALFFGTITIVVIYVIYFIGLSGIMPSNEFMAGGESAVKLAFSKALGNFAGNALFIFVIISCIGTLNGCMIGCTRGLYSLSVRKMGPKYKMFSQVDNMTQMPTNSAVFGLLFSSIWLVAWYGNFGNWWGAFLDFSELPIVTIYGLYIPIFFWIMKTMDELNVFKRFVMPILAIIGSLFMIYAAYVSHGINAILIYLVIFIVIMSVGFLLKGKNN